MIWFVVGVILGAFIGVMAMASTALSSYDKGLEDGFQVGYMENQKDQQNKKGGMVC